MKIVKEILSYILIIVVVLLVKRFIFSPIRVNGPSMEPTLLDGDIMILNEIGYHINGVKRFDIVVVDYNDELIIKRVIGLPGDSVKYINNELYINDELISEDFTHNTTDNYELKEIIPEGYYFVVGDNRPVSMDSRKIGLVSEDLIIGKTKTTIFPFSRFGAKK